MIWKGFHIIIYEDPLSLTQVGTADEDQMVKNPLPNESKFWKKANSTAINHLKFNKNVMLGFLLSANVISCPLNFWPQDIKANMPNKRFLSYREGHKGELKSRNWHA